MALKNFEFKVDISGIVPNTITNAGTQGDHGVTRLNFVLSDELRQGVNRFGAEGSVLLYRFDIHNGEGCIFQGKPTMLNEENIFIELEEQHTRFGGKITVYLVITALSSDNKTKMELYSFPVVLRLKNRPEGIYKDGENYESVSGLAKIAEQGANTAVQAAVLARQERENVSEYVSSIEEKLNNGELDGVGVESAQIIDDELIITYTNGVTQNLGNVKGDTGPQGEKGDKGDTPDLTNYYTKDEVDNSPYAKYITEGKEIGDYVQISSPDTNSFIKVNNVGVIVSSAGTFSIDQSRMTQVGEPLEDYDAVNKKYVDTLVGDMEIALDELHDYAQAIIGGVE